VLRGCLDVVTGLLLMLSCALLLAVLAARLAKAWLLVLGVRTRRSGTLQVETVGQKNNLLL